MYSGACFFLFLCQPLSFLVLELWIRGLRFEVRGYSLGCERVELYC